MLTASRAGEYSFEGQALPGAAVPGSVFTAGLVEGLRTGAADASGDGYVSVDEAYDYAYRYVRASGAARPRSGGYPAARARSCSPAARPGSSYARRRCPRTWPPASTAATTVSASARSTNSAAGCASRDLARAVTAERALRQVADTDNPAVAAVARGYLAAAGQPKAPERVHSGQTRTARLLAEAERIAESITDAGEKASALRLVAEAVPAAAPGSGVPIAQPVTGEYETVAAASPERAVRLAQSVTDAGEKASALRKVAKVVAVTDPDRAVGIAQSIADPETKEWALGDVAEVVAATNPDRAVRIVESITDQAKRELAQRDMVAVVAVIDPDHAERIAQSITADTWKASALSKIAAAVAAADPDRAGRLLADAEYFAQLETCKPLKDDALRDVAKAVAITDPDRAEHLARSITDYRRDAALRQVAEVVAATDPDRAERIARSITDPKLKVLSLVQIAKA